MITSSPSARAYTGTNWPSSNVPEVEAGSSPELILNPVTISRNEHEKVLIEPSQ